MEMVSNGAITVFLMSFLQVEATCFLAVIINVKKFCMKHGVCSAGLSVGHSRSFVKQTLHRCEGRCRPTKQGTYYRRGTVCLTSGQWAGLRDDRAAIYGHMKESNVSSRCPVPNWNS